MASKFVETAKSALNSYGSFFEGVRKFMANMHNITIIPMYRVIGKNVPGGDNGGSVTFLLNAMKWNALSSLLQTASIGIEAVVAEVLFVIGKFWYYKFPINPQTARFSLSKLQSIEESSDMAIVNTYRDKAVPFNITGHTGCTLPRFFMEAVGSDSAFPTETLARYPKLSAAWFKFRQLEKFYKEVNGDVIIMYDMDLYVGKLVSLGYNQDANNPWIINYDMQFILYPELALHTLSVYDYKPFFNSMFNRYAKSFADDFEGKSRKTTKPE